MSDMQLKNVSLRNIKRLTVPFHSILCQILFFFQCVCNLPVSFCIHLPGPFITLYHNTAVCGWPNVSMNSVPSPQITFWRPRVPHVHQESMKRSITHIKRFSRGEQGRHPRLFGMAWATGWVIAFFPVVRGWGLSQCSCAWLRRMLVLKHQMEERLFIGLNESLFS